MLSQRNWLISRNTCLTLALCVCVCVYMCVCEGSPSCEAGAHTLSVGPRTICILLVFLIVCINIAPRRALMLRLILLRPDRPNLDVFRQPFSRLQMCVALSSGATKKPKNHHTHIKHALRNRPCPLFVDAINYCIMIPRIVLLRVCVCVR